MPDLKVLDTTHETMGLTKTLYVWADATYVKCREGGHVSSCALVTAIGAGSDDYRCLLGLDAADTESYAGWLSFLRSLQERGVEGVGVTSEAHERLRRAIGEAFPDAAWQRCVVYPMCNAASCAPMRRKRGRAGHPVRGPRRARPGAGARALPPRLRGDRRHMPEGGRAFRGRGGRCSGLPGLSLRAPSALAHQQQRTGADQSGAQAQVFPSKKSLIRMLGAVFSEMGEDRASWRWFTEGSIALASSPARSDAPAAAYDGTPAEHARRIIEMVVADNPIGRRAA